ncbi:site-specific DNA-methyltransferase [[Mycoplasma] falconis]|uniref:Methyltransferase n=1 Tax=[Mycoplasma] falconis TaxID=92403 RepID=A0A501XAX8_9BACT|nr:site-specific DNA-methyltransferase [[Mycoplasma] falconis]TPE57579.1 site-specific DNA-methyltransferase [[Mycoplasma] falconis]
MVNNLNIENIKNTVIQGDSIEVLKQIPDNSIDFIFADPPYFMQTNGELFRFNGQVYDGVKDEWDKFNNYKEYDLFSLSWLKECKRILKNTGSIVVIGSFQNIYRLGYIMQDLGFWILNDLIWSKTNPVPNFGGTRFCNSHETMLWCSKSSKSKPTFNYKTMKYLNNDKQEKSVWNIALCNGKERLKNKEGKKLHSTQKPEKLLEKIILAATKPNDIVLDPFFGTGTTGAAAKKLGRNYIGIEKEQEYISAADMRIKNIQPELNDINLLRLEVKPPRVSLEKLVENNYLKEGQELYSPDKKAICKILFNGKVWDGLEELSIHKMSAKVLNKINHNGWEYFYVYYKNTFIPLNNLRYIYQEEHNE